MNQLLLKSTNGSKVSTILTFVCQGVAFVSIICTLLWVLHQTAWCTVSVRCGKGVVEVKCPYSCQDVSLQEECGHSKFFLKVDADGKLVLDVTHVYYYQVQAQLKVCRANYCDFVVWREEELFVQRIYPDDTFVDSALEKCEQFIKVAVLPELLGKWYSKEPLKKLNSASLEDDNDQTGTDHDDTGLCCYCRKEESGQMITCDNAECYIQWFHTKCLHVKKIPKGKWFCPDCCKRKQKNSRVQ